MFRFRCLVIIPWSVFLGPVKEAAGACDKAWMQCANLGNISYPFADARACAASRSFVISNCSSDQAYWYAFTEAYWPYTNNTPPAVMGIHRAGPIIFLDIAWEKALIGSPPCTRPFSGVNLASPFPHPFKLSYLDSYAFEFSPHNIYLLLNCTWSWDRSIYQNAQINTSLCQHYQEQCNMFREATCIQYIPFEELLLLEALDIFHCTHFQYFVSMDNSLAVDQWRTGLVQLAHTDGRCQSCESTYGSCVFDGNGSFRQCSCSDMTYSNTYCIIKPDCTGGLCNTSAKIAVGVCVPIAAISLLVIIVIYLYQYRERKRRRVVDGTPANMQNNIANHTTTTNIPMNRVVQGLPVMFEQPPQSPMVLATTMSSDPQQNLESRNENQPYTNQVGNHE